MAWMVQELRQSGSRLMNSPDVSIINDPAGMTNALAIASALRRVDISCETVYGGKIKNNMKRCDGYFIVVCEGDKVKLRNPRNYRTEEASKDEVIHSLIDHFNNDWTDFTPLIEKIVCDDDWIRQYYECFPQTAKAEYPDFQFEPEDKTI